MKRQQDDFFFQIQSVRGLIEAIYRKAQKIGLSLKKLIVEAGNGSSNKTVNALFLTSKITALLLKMFSFGVNVLK